MKTQRYFIFVLLVALVIGCQDNFAPRDLPEFVAKKYHPLDENTAKEKVMSFLAAVKKTNPLRTSFDDTEINEGQWIMEATGNFQWNANLDSSVIVTVREYEMTIDNVPGTPLKLSGTDMTEKFADLEEEMEGEISFGTSVAAIDVVIKDAESLQTHFTVRAVVTESTSDLCLNASDVPGLTNMDYISYTTEYCVNNYMLEPYSQSPDCFYPDFMIVSCEGFWITPDSTLTPDVILTDNGRPCANDEPTVCFYGGEEIEFYTNSAQDLVSQQADIALLILEDINEEFLAGPCQNCQLGPPNNWFEVDLEVFEYEIDELPGFVWYNIGVANVIYAFGPTYCW